MHDHRIARALEENAAFVRGIAAALATDGHAADDLFQDVCVAALERPPQHFGNVRAWLARVVERLAMRGRRASRRRTERETAGARPEHQEAAHDAVAAREVLHTVTAAVLALDEPYRAAILMRYYEGLDAARIATRTGVPPATVRRRLRHALALLRADLDRRSHGDRGVWMSALAPVIGSAKTGSTGLVAVLATSSGAWTMATAAKVTIGLAASACAVTLGWWGKHTLTAPEHRESPLALIAPSREERGAEVSEVVEPARDARAVELPEAPAPRLVVPSTASPQEPSEEEQLGVLYAALSANELEAAAKDILAELAALTHPLYQQRLDAGLYEVLGDGNEYTLRDEDEGLVSVALVEVGREEREIRRVELTEAEFPELHAKWRTALWLTETARLRRGAKLESAR